jgi:hypothetical protein
MTRAGKIFRLELQPVAVAEAKMGLARLSSLGYGFRIFNR